MDFAACRQQGRGVGRWSFSDTAHPVRRNVSPFFLALVPSSRWGCLRPYAGQSLASSTGRAPRHLPVLKPVHTDWATQLAGFLPEIGGPGIFGQGPLGHRRAGPSGQLGTPAGLVTPALHWKGTDDP